MIWLVGYLAALAVAVLFNRGAHSKPAPMMRVEYRLTYPEKPLSESSGCESSRNEVWDGTLPGPVPSP